MDKVCERDKTYHSSFIMSFVKPLLYGFYKSHYLKTNIYDFKTHSSKLKPIKQTHLDLKWKTLKKKKEKRKKDVIPYLHSIGALTCHINCTRLIFERVLAYRLYKYIKALICDQTYILIPLRNDRFRFILSNSSK